MYCYHRPMRAREESQTTGEPSLTRWDPDGVRQIRLLPRIDRPREKLAARGPTALSDTELLADHLFEPLMRGSSALARTMTPLVGSGPGSGMGLMFVLFGLLGTLVTVAGYLYRPVRNIETSLPEAVPDHPVAPATQAARPPAE